MSPPLAGVRVLDLSTEIAGPYCTKLLADAGADVLKIEHPDGGDPLRRWTASGQTLRAGDDGALFRFLNTSKRSAVVDHTTSTGRERLLALAAAADIVVESFAPGTIEALGLGPAALWERDRRVSFISISAFGRGGPWSQRPATEFTLQAWCGSTAARGTLDRPPIAAGGRLGEWLGGTYAAVAALTAYWGARRSGRGEHVDLALLEVMALTMAPNSMVWESLAGQPSPFARTVEVPSIEPARDAYVGFCTITAQQWRDFLALIERPDLADDETLAKWDERVRRVQDVNAMIHRWTRQHTVNEVVERAAALRIPVAAIGTGDTVAQFDHFVARAAFVPHPGATFVQPRPPYRLSAASLQPLSPAPRLGAHACEWRAGDSPRRRGPPPFLTFPRKETVDFRSNGPSTSSGRTGKFIEISPRTVRAEPFDCAQDRLVEALFARKSTVAKGGRDPQSDGRAEFGPHSTAEPAPHSTAEPARSVGRPLTGLRIIDFTAFWAGPFATHYLAAMGADVIKIESIQHPDGMRFQSVRPATSDRWWEWSALFQTVNLGKRGITLDLSRPAGVTLVKRLLAGADVAVENFSPRVMDNLGLVYDELAGVNPRLIMVRMPAFGLDGPWRDRVGFAQTMEQLTGMAWLTGFADGPPVLPRGPCDPLAGLHALVALLVALEHRARSGRGQLVEATMVESALNAAAELVLEHGAYGARLMRDGNRGPVGAPQNLYACRGADRWLALAVATDAQWCALVSAMGDPPWARDAALASAAGRRAHHDRIDAGIGAWCRDRDAEGLAEELLQRGIPAAPVLPAARLDQNPQLRARGFFETVVHPVVGTHAHPALPLRLASYREPWYTRPAPTLGEHTEEVLRQILGISDEEMAQLRADAIIGDRPVGLVAGTPAVVPRARSS